MIFCVLFRWAVQDKGFDPVTHNGNGLNLLSLSIKLGKADIFEFLLQKTSTDVNEQLPKNGTYLHMAVLHGQEEIVKKLLENKAKIDLKDEDGQTPFDLLTKDQTKITELLMISHISNTIKSGDFDEESKIQQLTNFLTKYRKKFETSKDDTNNLSKSVIAIAEKLNLQKLVKWLQRNAVLFEGKFFDLQN